MTPPVARVIVLTSLLWLIACGNPAASAGARTQASEAVVITGQASGAPVGCGVPEVGRRLLDFAAAFNDRNPEAALAFFNGQAPFAWYSAPDSEPQSTTTIYSTDDLPEYFERRQAQNEILHFQRIKVNGWEAERGLVHFDFTLNRQADDLYDGIGVEVVGKGAFHCQTQSFAAISIGDARAQ